VDYPVDVFSREENLGSIRATRAAMLPGPTFKWIKAAWVIPTTLLTLPLLVYAGVILARRQAAPKET